ncbi:HET-domain-containing protein, partial [Stipitochalara longipes BDJ]
MGQYLALSYCWGGPQAVTTTTITLAAYRQCIDLKSLPKTIINAITVTRKLGIKYLWIDALCILQDSDEDKGREIDNMKNIYKNAYFTISAACTRACEDGFLQPRIRNPQPQHFKIPYACPNGIMGTIILQTPKHYIKPEDEPLNKRGWTLQERLLSPRLLIYGITDLYWECQTKHASNGGKGGAMIGGSKLLKDPQFTQNLAESIEAKRSRWQQNWMEIVEDYTTRSLTVAEDKLTAISSIAEAHVFDDDTYTAGLWKSWLLEGLMWFVPLKAISTPPWHITLFQARYKGYIAPSWSWASLNSPVIYASKAHYKGISGVCPELKVLKCEVIPAPLSRVSGGTLTLMGFIR